MSSHRACHPTSGHVIPPPGHVITCASHHRPSMSSHWLCHDLRILSSTKHVNPPVMWSPAYLIPYRAYHPTGQVIPPSMSSHRSCHPTGHVIPPCMSSHRACHPTSYVISASMSSYLCYPTGHNRACHLTGMASGPCHPAGHVNPTKHVIPLGILFYRACHPTKKKLNYNLTHLSCYALIYYSILSLRWSE